MEKVANTESVCELKVKWKSEVFSVSLQGDSSVLDFKKELEVQTGCRADRMKLFFRTGKVKDDDNVLRTAESTIQEQAMMMKVSQIQDSQSKEKAQALYTHSDGKAEMVDLIKKHDESAGGGWTVFVPSTGRERQTVTARLDFSAYKEKENEKEKEQSIN
mmetsp:Transcript_8552/g.10078  ORF Transcript_8552/g.10078 Transcript_8552/m.10078 type:complete len:160 (-) Transcript_8552:199-678(-)